MGATTKQLQRFWFGLLPQAYKSPVAAHAILLALSRGPGSPDLVAYQYTGRGAERMRIPPKLARLPADDVFESLRWSALVDGYRPQPGPLHNEEFDSGDLRCELHVGRRVAEPKEGVAPTDLGWQQLADWPRSVRRLLIHVTAESVLPMSFGGSQTYEMWPPTERSAIAAGMVPITDRVTRHTPRMIIDALYDQSGHELWLLDLLALDGEALLGRPFGERQRLLSQEVSELRAGWGHAWDPNLWAERKPAGRRSIWARSGATYARDLLRVG